MNGHKETVIVTGSSGLIGAALIRHIAKDVQVVKNYVQVLILKGRVEEANKLNEDFLKAHPKDEVGLTYRGEIELAQGKASDAVRTLQSVVTGDPNMAMAHYQLGDADAARRLYAQAVEWMEKKAPQNSELLRFRTEAEQVVGP